MVEHLALDQGVVGSSPALPAISYDTTHARKEASGMTDVAARQVDGKNIAFLALVHALAVAGVLYAAFVHFSWWTVGLAFLWATLCGLSITGGYHRLFSHRAYRAAGWLRLFYLLFGAASFQNSALKWSSDHRIHHHHTDGDADPYNIRKGFWWAHIGWVFFQDPTPEPDAETVPDLMDDPLVRFQHRHYVALGVVVGFVLPAALGLLWGDPWGALLLAGFLRLAVQYHATFSINSFAHLLGSQPYSRLDSARDSVVTALLTLGEGYHNFHHRFPADYRNGIRAWHFDPTKWWIWTLARVGAARDLRRTAAAAIEKAREETRRRA